MVVSVRVGDVFVSTWGYEQTNATFYQVVKVSALGVSVRKIRSKQVENSQSMTGHATPIKNAFDGVAFYRKLRYYDGEVYFTGEESYMSANKWDGKPVHVSFYG